MSKSKNNPTLTVPALNAAIVVAGSDPVRFSGDVAWDIETGPLSPDSEDGALLSAETARVSAIGYYEPAKDRYVICYDKDEAAMLRQFWDIYLSLNGGGRKMVGFNIHGFDLPFLVKRSWHFSIVVPKNIMTYRSWSDTFVDLMAQWRCGAYKDFISLDALSRYLGVGQKTGSGEKFHRLWETDRQAAIDYLANDVRITHRCGVKMGFVSPASMAT